MRPTANSIAIVLAGALIAGAILFVFRWDFHREPPVMVDRWTGQAHPCGAEQAPGTPLGLRYKC
jgi:hypothetical protein